MGTTLTAALVDGRPRASRPRRRQPRLPVARREPSASSPSDHTLVARMVKAGEITPRRPETHPHRNVLTRSLGTDATCSSTRPTSRSRRRPVLLCSDGLTGMVTEADPGDPGDRARPPGGRRPAGQGREPGRRDRQHHGVVLDFSDDGSGPGGAKTEQVPHQPTVERPGPQASPPRRSDITIVGAPIPGPPPKDRARSPVPVSSRTAGPRRHRARKVGTGIGVTVGLLVLGVVGLRLYLDAQWYVGESDGKVAVFRGVPAECRVRPALGRPRDDDPGGGRRSRWRCTATSPTASPPRPRRRGRDRRADPTGTSRAAAGT